MKDKKITLDRALALNVTEINNLQSDGVRALIDEKAITLDTALNLTYDQRDALSDETIRARVIAGTLNIGLVHLPCLQGYVNGGFIALERALTLDVTEINNLRSVGIRALIDAGTIDLDLALNFTYDQRSNLESQEIQDLVANNTITVAEAIYLTEEELTALRDPQTRQRLRNREITIVDILGHQRAHGAALVVPNINDGQSTHNASVHQAVSESAARLAARYQRVIDKDGLESVISMVKTYVNSLPDNSPKNIAVKRCVLRITARDYTFTDNKSQITTRKLLALTFIAISDDFVRDGTLEDARTQFVEGLYEIQRGYNLSATGVDEGGLDRHICSAGTFNKLIEKLQGIHPDCQIRFITKVMASLKLPIVVREESIRHIKSLANQNTYDDLQVFTQLISQVQKDGVELIWDQIKGKVADRMFDEFGSLYQNRQDDLFTGLIDAGQHTELTDTELSDLSAQSLCDFFVGGNNDVKQITAELKKQIPAFEKFEDGEQNKVAKQIFSLGQLTNTSCASGIYSCLFESSSAIKQRKLYAIIKSLLNLEIPCLNLENNGYEGSIDYKEIGLFSTRDTETRQVINIIAGHQTPN